MSKINTLRLNYLRNDGHYQYHTDVLNLIDEFDGVKNKLGELTDKYRSAHATEDAALKKIVKSDFTIQLQEADAARDDMWMGIVETTKTSLRHYGPTFREAARKLKIVLDTYGNITKKPMLEQTSAVYNALQELNGNYADLVNTLRLKGWVDALEEKNKLVESLMKDRIDESSAKITVAMKAARAETDAVYRAIVERISAFVVIEGAAAFEGFIAKLNLIISKYAQLTAQSGGKGKGNSNNNNDKGGNDE